MGAFGDAMFFGACLLQVLAMFNTANTVDVFDVGCHCHCHTRNRRLYCAGGIRILLVQSLCAFGASSGIRFERKCIVFPIESFAMFDTGLQRLLVAIFMHSIFVGPNIFET